jgi:hypothetical protein
MLPRFCKCGHVHTDYRGLDVCVCPFYPVHCRCIQFEEPESPPQPEPKNTICRRCGMKNPQPFHQTECLSETIELVDFKE